MIKEVNVVGGGLAGVEATYQLIKEGIPVHLYEMRPVKRLMFIRQVILRNLYVLIHYVQMV